MTTEQIPIRCSYSLLCDLIQLIPNPRNPNRHSEAQIALLAKIIRYQGWRSPIVVSNRSGFIVAGHARYEAAKALQVELVPVDFQDFASEADEWAHLIADNRITELAEISVPDLSELLKELDGQIDLELTGFTTEALQDLEGFTEEGTVDAEPQIDQAEELQKQWNTARGQVWELGGHRLMCGDCRSREDVAQLMSGEKINIAFTSPPYAEQREYDETSGFKPIPPEEFIDWFEDVQANVAAHLAPDGSWFVNIKPCADGLDTNLYVFDLVLAHVRKWHWHFATEFCWERNGVPKQVTHRFKNQFEPIYQFAKGAWKIRPDNVKFPSENAILSLGPGSGNTSWKNTQGSGKSFIAKNRIPTRPKATASDQQGMPNHDMFGADRPIGFAFPGNRLPNFVGTHDAWGHSAAFPVGLPQWFLKAFTDDGDIVYEPFSGSGSTIIAAENTKRRCRALEISPGYVAVALQRWADATSKTPTLLE